MILNDQEFSPTRVLVIVGVVIFISSLIYTSILVSKLVSLRRTAQKTYAEEVYQPQRIGTTAPTNSTFLSPSPNQIH